MSSVTGREIVQETYPLFEAMRPRHDRKFKEKRGRSRQGRQVKTIEGRLRRWERERQEFREQFLAENPEVIL